MLGFSVNRDAIVRPAVPPPTILELISLHILPGECDSHIVAGSWTFGNTQSGGT